MTSQTASTRQLRRRDALEAASGWLTLGVLLLATGALFFHLTRDTTLWLDEWTWALDRRSNSAAALLEPHNGHLSLVPVAVYKLLFATVGLDDHGPYRVVLIVTHLTLVALVFVYARLRVGSFLALLAAVLILLLGPGWENILWPFQIGYLTSLAAGIGTLLLLDRRSPTADLGAAVLLAISVASSGVGLAVAFGVAIDLLAGRRRWRDLWIVAGPLALYAIWWLVYQETDPVGELLSVPPYVADSFSASVGALAGLSGQTVPRQEGTLVTWGRPLAAVALVLAIWRLVRLRTVPPRLLALTATVVVFWAATEFSRGGFSSAWEPRYLYVGALYVVLAAVELVKGISVSRTALAIATAVVLAVTISNVGHLREGATYLRDGGQVTRAALGAADIARPVMSSEELLSEIPGAGLLRITAGDYVAVKDDVGLPALTAAQIAGQAVTTRRQVDAELIGLHDLVLRESRLRGRRSSTAPATTYVSGGSVTRRGRCLGYQPASAARGDWRITVPPGGLAVRVSGPAAPLGLLRFGDQFQPLGSATGPGTTVLPIRPDRAAQPWQAQVRPGGPTLVCAVG